jgi:hypothetical protein
VIATGFDQAKNEDPLDFVQQSYERSARQAPPQRERAPVEEDYRTRTFEREDLDIPAFLRRSRTNGR